ncbi:hypothetical protein [Peptacetobacter sp. AB800]|uniref:hypothetical protein n=1 Tax=Peptacetobacter sp. AB800 TaxID=3388428 RepID=UPI0039FD8D74
MIFGLSTKKEVAEIQQAIIDDYEKRLINKDEIIESYEKRLESNNDFVKELKSELSNVQSENVVLKKEIEDKDGVIRSYRLVLNRINNERGKLFNTKSVRIKKKYAKKIDEKLEGM